MKGFLKKAKADLEGILKSDSSTVESPINQQSGQGRSKQTARYRGMEQDQPSVIQEPTPLDILRYRYHHGTNLGSIYVIERWLHPSRLPDGADGSSELASVTAWVEKIGIEATREKFEEHWANAVSDDDIKWLVSKAKCKCIERLPTSGIAPWSPA